MDRMVHAPLLLNDVHTSVIPDGAMRAPARARSDPGPREEEGHDQPAEVPDTLAYGSGSGMTSVINA
jgi:hypothetical protein